MKTLSFDPSALVSPRVALGLGAVLVTCLFGGTGCGLSYSLTGLSIQPGVNLTCVTPGVSAQFHAYGTYTEGGHAAETKDLTDQVFWSSTIPVVANVNTSGLVTAGLDYVGTTSIIATTNGEFGNLTAVSNINVMSPSCSSSSSIAKAFSLHLIPGNQTLTSVGDTMQLLAIATSGNGEKTTDLSRQATWTSSDPKVATVDSTGLVTGVGAGDAVITVQTRTPGEETVSAAQNFHFVANNQSQ